MICQTKPMITGRDGDHPGAALRVCEQFQLIARSAFLEASRNLQMVELAINLTAAQSGQVERVWTRGMINDIINALTCSADGFDVDQFASHIGDRV